MGPGHPDSAWVRRFEAALQTLDPGNRVTNLTAMRDSTSARWGESAVDFWTELALPGATIDPRYDSGDGIHLNDAGTPHPVRADGGEGDPGRCGAGATGGAQVPG